METTRINENNLKEEKKQTNIRNFIIVGVILVILAITNPTIEDFTAWAVKESSNESTNVLELGLIAVLGKSIFNSITTEKDFIIFSIFEINELNGQSFKVMGIFNNFIPLGSY